jgi:nicotinate phosphoribosyltransferase
MKTTRNLDSNNCRKFYTVRWYKMKYFGDQKDILNNKLTDVYFRRTADILHKLNKNPYVIMEIACGNLPQDYQWGVLCGLEEFLLTLKGKNVDVEGLKEGSLFFEDEPILTIKGHYMDFGMLETPLLGFICQASGIATKAARCRIAAGDRTLLSFGARRMYPLLSPMIDRSAFIGGMDGVSVIKSAEVLNEKPKGTMPHALILIMGDTVKAAKAFHKYTDKDINRVVLIDTFLDEKIETLRVADELKDKLFAVRVDTPSSRRGNLLKICRELRWELDTRGYTNIKIFVSGGIDEKKILELNPFVDSYGVGTSVSNAHTIDFSMDIVSIEGKPLSKRGKMSGEKKIFECPSCGNRLVVPYKQETLKCDCGATMEPITSSLMTEGKKEESLPPQKIREFVLSQLANLQ